MNCIFAELNRQNQFIHFHSITINDRTSLTTPHNPNHLPPLLKILQNLPPIRNMPKLNHIRISPPMKLPQTIPLKSLIFLSQIILANPKMIVQTINAGFYKLLGGWLLLGLGGLVGLGGGLGGLVGEEDLVAD